MIDELVVDNYIENTLGQTDLNIGWSILEELTFAKDSLECSKIALALVEKIVAKSENDAVLSRVGAGVVESLLRSDHADIYNRILELALAEDSWASILKYTWFRENEAYRVISKEFPKVALLGRAFGEFDEEDDQKAEEQLEESSQAEEIDPTDNEN